MKRYTEGFSENASLWQEGEENGIEGRASAVRHWLRLRFRSPKHSRGEGAIKRSVPDPPQWIAFLMLKADPTRHRYLKKLYRHSEEIALLGTIARELFEMIRTRNATG